MKMYKYIWQFLFATLLLSSCSDFLETEPLGTETGQNFLNDEVNAVLAINAAYDAISWDEGGKNAGHNYEWMFGDVLSDDAAKGSKPSDFQEIIELEQWRTNADHGITSSTWNNYYAAIFRANQLIEGYPEATISNELKNRLLGEAFFIRAYAYLYLVSKFGGVPLFSETVKPSEFGNVQKGSIAEGFAFIVDDFTKAIDMLPEKSQYAATDLGRATKGAARAYLARTMTYEMGIVGANGYTWQQVYEQSNAIINSGEYYLAANFAELFELEGENGPGSIFEIQFTSNNEGWGPIKSGTTNNVIQANRTDWGWGFNNPTLDLVLEFESGDPRLASTAYADGDILHGITQTIDDAENETGYMNRKATLEPDARPNNTKDSPQNIRKFRYADILLIHAEAAFHLGMEDEARNKINMVRDRARNSTKPKGSQEGSLTYLPYSSDDLNGVLPPVTASGQNLLLAIMHERRVELAMEGLRYYDQLRWGTYMSKLDNDIKANCESHLISGTIHPMPVMAIPLNESQSWGIEQNPGY